MSGPPQCGRAAGCAGEARTSAKLDLRRYAGPQATGFMRTPRFTYGRATVKGRTSVGQGPGVLVGFRWLSLVFRWCVSESVVLCPVLVCNNFPVHVEEPS